jgi:hypothetical protein
MYSLIFAIELTWIYLPMLSTVSLFLDLKQGEKGCGQVPFFEKMIEVPPRSPILFLP